VAACSYLQQYASMRRPLPQQRSDIIVEDLDERQEQRLIVLGPECGQKLDQYLLGKRDHRQSCATRNRSRSNQRRARWSVLTTAASLASQSGTRRSGARARVGEQGRPVLVATQSPRFGTRSRSGNPKAATTMAW
jgi:hypothetical protein